MLGELSYIVQSDNSSKLTKNLKNKDVEMEDEKCNAKNIEVTLEFESNGYFHFGGRRKSFMATMYSLVSAELRKV